MRYITVRALLFLLIAASLLHAQTPSYFRSTLPPGPHPVGLRVVEQYDYSRTWRPLTDQLGKPTAGARARPLQTLIWYPADRSDSKPMTVGDYANLAMTETTFGKPDPNTGDGWRAAMKPTLADAMWAVRDAAPAPGRFPVFIYAPSFGSMSWENADLCEYLASNGYLVLATTALGATGRDMTNDVVGINAQARDISFLIGYAQSLPDADLSE